MNTSSETEPPPPPTSFSSLPYDIVLNCLARISRFHYPSLSLVSKKFHSLIVSPDLEATRSSIGKTEDYLCVCLNLNPNPRWFTVSPIPKQKLKPLPWFPHQYPQSSTVVSTGSKIYTIGGFVRRKRSRGVLILDCRSHQWRRLPKMRQPRGSTAAEVVNNGRILVLGGSRSKKSQDFGEVYDPKTNTWNSTTLDTTVLQNNGALLMGGKVYFMKGLQPYLKTDYCLVKIDEVLCITSVSDGNLVWREPKQGLDWSIVKGLDDVCSNHLLWVAFCGGERVTVWWKSGTRVEKIDPQSGRTTETCDTTHIWCAQISFERRGLTDLWGFVQWSKQVLDLDGLDSTPDFFLTSAIVTY